VPTPTHPHRLAEVPLFAGLPTAALDRLAASCRRRDYQADQELFAEGDPGDSLVVLEDGQLRVVRYTSAGTEVVLAVVEAPAALGELSLLDGAPRDATVRAQRRSTVRLVPRQVFLALLRDEPAFVEGLLTTLAGWVRRANKRQTGLLGLDVSGRLAEWLLERAERQGGSTLALGRTQGELAAELGTTRSTLNRALQEFASLRYLEIDGELVTILDADALRAFVS
jgi:CRP-like cAMP-binding protein